MSYESILVEQDYCPKGWRQHVDPLLEYLDKRKSKMTVLQIKEKFGHLRFYYDKVYPPEDALIDYVEFLCGLTCTDCGSTKDVETKVITGWIYTLCGECMNKKENERKQNLEKDS